MDNDCIAYLKDYQLLVENSIKKMEKKFKEYKTSKNSDILKTITKEINSSKGNINLMEMEIANLNDEENASEWNEIINKLNKKVESLKKQLNEINNSNIIDNTIDESDIDVKIDKSKLTSKQAMKRGDKILQEDKKALTNMKKVVHGDIDTMKGVNIELNRQNEVLENVDDDLKEIDFSLKRAGKQMKTMLKMYATDKLIMCMIFVIILIIVIIIIVAAVGKDKNKNFNVPHDIFNSNSNSGTTSATKLRFLRGNFLK